MAIGNCEQAIVSCELIVVDFLKYKLETYYDIYIVLECEFLFYNPEIIPDKI